MVVGVITRKCSVLLFGSDFHPHEFLKLHTKSRIFSEIGTFTTLTGKNIDSSKLKLKYGLTNLQMFFQLAWQYLVFSGHGALCLLSAQEVWFLILVFFLLFVFLKYKWITRVEKLLVIRISSYKSNHAPNICKTKLPKFVILEYTYCRATYIYIGIQIRQQWEKADMIT